ncbi:type II secretion system secretin GspD [Pseudobdellovibrio exovorus]|uniref:General secretion pathway protein D n=1 Tax=Pseudobdellovibrio exovorus JSS TaxID=1184267 RepID=M4V8K9_9BACT|nr:type II secretion system secretin GspD [Pseudobdellovibrio exovorus]AGH95737.1 general secretion pathway protein D [Pseudobdellovibrio exovorus JSS]
MTFQKRIVSTVMATSLLFTLNTHAQFDDPMVLDQGGGIPPADSFSPPPAFGVPTSSPTNETVIKSSNNKSGVLNDNQRNKFARSNPEDITSENFPETIESFDFPNVEITDVIKAISELTGKNFIIDSTVRGKITIMAPSKITVAEAYKAFLSALAINGFTVVPSGGFLKIRNARSAQRDNIDTYSGTYYPNSDQMITKIVHLKHISAETVQKDLRLLASSYGEFATFPQTNSLIISDFGANIDRVMKIINQLDVPGFEDQLEVVGIKYAKAKDIAELIDKVVNKGQNRQSSVPGGGFAAGVPRFGVANTAQAATSSKQGANYFMVFPEDRTNSLVVVGNKAGIDRVKRLIAQLDFKVKAEDQGGVYVYYVKHGEAEKIAETLQQVAKDSGPRQQQGSGATPGLGLGLAPQGQAATVAGIFGGDVSIKADKNTNSLVISASKPDYDQVLGILQKLDIPRDQVYVQAIIMEMSLSDGFKASGGVVKFNESGGKSGFVGSESDLTSILNPLGGAGSAVLAFSEGPITVSNPLAGSGSASTLTIPSLVAFLKFIKSFGKTNILSTPQITAMDSQQADIEVGDRVIVGSRVVPGTNGSASLEEPTFDDATIKMSIKPFISPNSDSIRMEFTQNVKQLIQGKVPTQFVGRAQSMATRSIKTNVNVNNGDTAVIGGLIRDEETESTLKVPLLGDLPIVGWLFKGKDIQRSKVNMVVFLTPKIIRSAADQQALLNFKAQERLNFIKQQGGEDPYGSTMDQILKQNARGNNDAPPLEDLEMNLE